MHMVRRPLFMKLSMEMLEGQLRKKTIQKNYDGTADSLYIESQEMFVKPAKLKTGILYLAAAENLPPSIVIEPNACMICIGIPPDYYFKSALHLLVINHMNICELANIVSQIFLSYNLLERNLLRAISSGESVQHMVDLIAPFFNGNEIFVLTDEYRIVGKSNPTLHIREISKLPQPDENGFFDPESVALLKKHMSLGESINTHDPFIEEVSFIKCRMYLTNIFKDGKVIGRIVLAEDCQPFAGYEAALLKFLNYYLETVFNSIISSEENLRKNYIPNLFSDFLGGDSSVYVDLENSILQRGWNPADWYICAYILPSEKDYNMRTVSFLCGRYNMLYPECCFFEYRKHIICVANLSGYDNSPDLFADSFASMFKEQGFQVGYSSRFSNLIELQSRYHQAKIALETGLHHAPSQISYLFHDYVMHYFEDRLTSELNGQYLYAPEIEILRAYDAEKNTEYLKTLRVYLANQQNSLQSAKDLFIHRNSMEQRLKRIRELTNLDFNDTEKILYISLSFRFFITDEI